MGRQTMGLTTTTVFGYRYFGGLGKFRDKASIIIIYYGDKQPLAGL